MAKGHDQSEPLRALVVGGGIGGVTGRLRRALHGAGIDAAVFEQAQDVRSIYVGSGIHLWNNTMRALAEIGLDRKVMETSGSGSVVEHFDLWSHRGQRLASIPLERTRSRIGAECVGINRAELLPALAEELPEGMIRMGRRCTGFEQDDSGVVVRFEDGAEERGDVLIGADGVRSVIRTQLHGEMPPRYAGYTIWQGITRVPQKLSPIGVFTIFFGPGQRFAYYHVDAERLYWFAVANAPEAGSEPPDDRKPMLLDRFGDWPDPIARIVESTAPEATHRRDLYDRAPDKRWGEGRTTLLGDAAHAMTFGTSARVPGSRSRMRWSSPAVSAAWPTPWRPCESMSASECPEAPTCRSSRTTSAAFRRMDESARGSLSQHDDEDGRAAVRGAQVRRRSDLRLLEVAELLCDPLLAAPFGEDPAYDLLAERLSPSGHPELRIPLILRALA